ncbi:hypothetical protein [Streptomyces sp. CC208A]|uniref:RICIN domain-containing protein n=1 Tax=Streptomyces sp. CC208A TaxID=3044573 RepID=UPI0024A953A9|nr:hypothetical protein [Streptomyces sp. CC208A]
MPGALLGAAASTALGNTAHLYIPVLSPVLGGVRTFTASDRSLDGPDSSMTDGIRLVTWSPNDGADQKWSTPAGPTAVAGCGTAPPANAPRLRATPPLWVPGVLGISEETPGFRPEWGCLLLMGRDRLLRSRTTGCDLPPGRLALL